MGRPRKHPEPESKPRREYGTGTLKEQPNGRWRAFLDGEPDPVTGRRRRVSAVGRTRTEAMGKAKARLRELELGEDPLAWDRAPTVREWCGQWVENEIRPRRAPNTYQSYEQRIRCSINPILGDIRLDRLRASHARLMERALTEGDPERGVRPVSGSTARLAQTVLNLALDTAVRDGVIPRNPLAGLDQPANDPVERTPLTPDEAARMIRMEPDPQWRLIWRLLFITGMRLGEVAAITPEAVRRVGGLVCVDVEWQVKRFPKAYGDRGLPRGFEHRKLTGTLWMTRPKTRNGRRVIPLPGDLGRDLEAWTLDAKPGEPVFHTRKGTPLDREGFRYHWAKALDRAGLPRINVHSARHTTATLLARLDVPDLYRKAIIGHASIDTTNTVYTHVDPLMLADAIGGVEHAIGDVMDA